jgi:hypothetical protein
VNDQQTGICYLCGKSLIGEIDDDHVPPKHLFSKEIRSKHVPNLLTLRMHKACNSSYQLDEEYFIHTFAPLVINTYAGKSILEELIGQYKKGRNVPLSRKIFAEFDKRPSGLYLPPGKIAKHFSADRVWRVIWKITRGLFFHEYDRYLPEDKPKFYEMASPGEKPPDKFFLLPADQKTPYPAVFDYRYRCFSEVDNFHVWAMLFWDQIIAVVSFHDPSCRCDICVSWTGRSGRS